MTHRFGRAGRRFGQTARYAGACFTQTEEDSKSQPLRLTARKITPPDSTAPAPTPKPKTVPAVLVARKTAPPDTAPDNTVPKPKEVPAVLVAREPKPKLPPKCCVVKVGNRYNLSCEPNSHPWHGKDVTAGTSCYSGPQGMMCAVKFTDESGDHILEISLCPPGKEPPEFKVPPKTERPPIVTRPVEPKEPKIRPIPVTPTIPEGPKVRPIPARQPIHEEPEVLRVPKRPIRERASDCLIPQRPAVSCEPK